MDLYKHCVLIVQLVSNPPTFYVIDLEVILIFFS